MSSPACLKETRGPEYHSQTRVQKMMMTMMMMMKMMTMMINTEYPSTTYP
jgi:hypothetical protein